MDAVHQPPFSTLRRQLKRPGTGGLTMLDVEVRDWGVPKNTNLTMYNAWFRKEYPELFECEIKDTVESCEDCGFCNLKSSKKEKETEK